jgi:hypothetical protein
LEFIRDKVLLDYFNKDEFKILYKNLFTNYDKDLFLEKHPDFLNLKIKIETKHGVDNLEKLQLEALSIVKTINLKNLDKKEFDLKKNLNSKEKIEEFQRILILK